MELLEYDFEIEHIAGEDNIVADGLSRFVTDLGKDPAVGDDEGCEPPFLIFPFSQNLTPECSQNHSKVAKKHRSTQNF